MIKNLKSHKSALLVMNEMCLDRTYLIHGCYALKLEEGTLACTLRNQPTTTTSCIGHYFNWSTTAIKIGQKQIRPVNMDEE